MDVQLQGRLLIVDDEKNIRRTLQMVLADLAAELQDCGSAEEALRLMREAPADVILLDIKLPGMDGIELLGKLRKEWPDSEVIMISGHATIQDAIEATRLGAYDVLEKPLDRDRVVLSIKNCMEKVTLNRQVAQLQTRLEGQFEMIGESQAMRHVLEEVRKVAPTNGRVLITGESGSGKELVARAVHRLSKRAAGPFVKVNCAAIPAELIESELFGYERGAFTGATNKKKGQFELANGGTLFLDEIGDMSLAAQAKVLRVLQTGELSHVGAEGTIQVDVRVLAATNRDLKKAVTDGTFREDLYFRLNVIPVHCPPLRDRLEDIPLLATRFVEEFCKENGFKRKEIEPGVLQKLKRYAWPGNIRELKNVTERMVIMSGERITAEDVPEQMSGDVRGMDVQRFDGMSLKDVRDDVEREYIRSKLDEYGWNITKTAEKLGIERTNLHKKIKQLNLKRAE
ncbi:MAG TPA: sigma-54 dependent transcriptional regulator [Myxococcota bacterium]|nr:sigma-54 dependent transcriptional regulator [Myxococcota bacterium]HRY96724.1 sigma-54 dependent transcriptional regulator [Myxococcota bacterium]